MLSCPLSRDKAQNRNILKKSEMYLIAEMVVHVYNKKKIQMSFADYGYNFTREVKNR